MKVVGKHLWVTAIVDNFITMAKTGTLLNSSWTKYGAILEKL
jgi:hypothetical protein